MPSEHLQKQNLLEFLYEIGLRLKNHYEYCWLIDGTRIKKPMDIPYQCRILIVSNDKKFKGIKNLHMFDPR